MANPLIGVVVMNINQFEVNKVSDMVVIAKAQMALLDYPSIRLQLHLDSIGAPPFQAEEVTIQHTVYENIPNNVE